MSAVRLGSPVRSRADGKEYPALLLSCANRKDRTNGRLFMGLLKEDGAYPGGARKYRIDWEYQYDVTPAGTLYAYSCLSELNDGRVAPFVRILPPPPPGTKGCRGSITGSSGRRR